jgi:hypothetical protein
MFSNPTKVLYMTLHEDGATGMVIDTACPPFVRHATPEDMKTAQYVEARFVKRKPAPGEGGKK